MPLKVPVSLLVECIPNPLFLTSLRKNFLTEFCDYYFRWPVVLDIYNSRYLHQFLNEPDPVLLHTGMNRSDIHAEVLEFGSEYSSNAMSLGDMVDSS